MVLAGWAGGVAASTTTAADKLLTLHIGRSSAAQRNATSLCTTRFDVYSFTAWLSSVGFSGFSGSTGLLRHRVLQTAQRSRLGLLGLHVCVCVCARACACVRARAWVRV